MVSISDYTKCKSRSGPEPKTTFETVWNTSWKRCLDFPPDNRFSGTPLFGYITDNQLSLSSGFRNNIRDFPDWLNKSKGEGGGDVTSTGSYRATLSFVTRFLKWLNDIKFKGQPITFEMFYVDPKSKQPRIDVGAITDFAKAIGLQPTGKFKVYQSSIAIKHFIEYLQRKDAEVTLAAFGKGGVSTTARSTVSQAQARYTLFNDEVDEYWRTLWNRLYPPLGFNRDAERRRQRMLKDMSDKEREVFYEKKKEYRKINLLEMYFRFLISTGIRPGHAMLLPCEALSDKSVGAVRDALDREFYTIPFKELVGLYEEGHKPERKNVPSSVVIPKDLYEGLKNWCGTVRSEGKHYIFGDFFDHSNIQAIMNQRQSKMTDVDFPARGGRNLDRRRNRNKEITDYTPYMLRHTWATTLYTLCGPGYLREAGGWETSVGEVVYATYMGKTDAIEIANSWGIFIPLDYRNEAKKALMDWFYQKMSTESEALDIPLAGVSPAMPPELAAAPGLPAVPAGPMGVVPTAMVPMRTRGEVLDQVQEIVSLSLARVTGDLNQKFRSQEEELKLTQERFMDNINKRFESIERILKEKK